MQLGREEAGTMPLGLQGERGAGCDWKPAPGWQSPLGCPRSLPCACVSMLQGHRAEPGRRDVLQVHEGTHTPTHSHTHTIQCTHTVPFSGHGC